MPADLSPDQKKALETEFYDWPKLDFGQQNPHDLTRTQLQFDRDKFRLSALEEILQELASRPRS